MEKFKGVFPPVVTPFMRNGDVDYEAFESNIKKWNEADLAGYLVIGSNSEAVFLNEKEKLRLIEIAVKNTSEGRHVIVGSGMEAARETIKFTNKCAELGAQSALILTPSYYSGSMTTPALIRYFTEVADHSEIPILIYNVTKFTHVNIEADAVKELSLHPNIIGMKDSNGNIPQLATFLRVADPSYQIMTGTFSAWYPALTLGITAIVSAMANCFPNEIARVQKLFDNGNWKKSRELYQIMFDVNTAITGKFGIPGLKYVMERCNYKGGYVRNPLRELDADAKYKLDEIVDAAIEKLAESTLMQ